MERLGVRSLHAALGDWQAGAGASLAGRLAAALREAIQTEVLVAGTVLPAERSLARALGISRSTVTTSLRMLKDEGLLEARHGSGTSVHVPGAARSVRSRGAIDLAESSPGDARALPVVGVDLDALLTAGSSSGLTPAGLPGLRRAVAERFTADGLRTDPSEIIITNGAQHALALCFAHRAEPGSAVVLDEPTYPGVLELLRARGLRPVPLHRVTGAIDVEGLRRRVETEGARLAYLQTLVHNPTGSIADDAALDELADTVDSLGLEVIEDVVLADLRFDGTKPRPLAARVAARELVAVVGSVSKLGWGGLRIGWLRAPAPEVELLLTSRRAHDLGSSVPSQVISAAVLAEFGVLAESRQRTLARRADLATRLLREGCPDWRFTPPSGGLSIWVDPGRGSADRIVAAAAERGVIVASGASSSVTEAGSRHLRICFDRPEPQLREGLRRLAEAAVDVAGRRGRTAEAGFPPASGPPAGSAR